MPSKLMVRCERCGCRQDPAYPICKHFLGKKGGLITGAKLVRLYGRDYFVRAGKRGAAVRWAGHTPKNARKLPQTDPDPSAD